jgi:hypothetical protein
MSGRRRNFYRESVERVQPDPARGHRLGRRQLDASQGKGASRRKRGEPPETGSPSSESAETRSRARRNGSRRSSGGNCQVGF